MSAPLTFEEMQRHMTQKLSAAAKIHDSIFYYEYLATLEDKKVGFDGHSKLWDKVRKGIDHFRQNNAEAYMVLLD